MSRLYKLTSIVIAIQVFMICSQITNVLATKNLIVKEKTPALSVKCNENLTVSLHWNTDPGAQYYIIKRGMTPDKMFPLPSKVTGNEYVDRSVDPLFATHYYSITPVINSHEEQASPIVILSKVSLKFDDNQKIPVLMYHQVLADGIKVTKPGLEMNIRELKQQLIYLKSQGYVPMFLKDIYQYLGKKRPLPSKTIVLTFDDGYRSFYRLVYPLLQQLNMKASVAVITAPVDKVQDYYYISWRQAKEMSDSGLVEVASHTVTHKKLPTLSKRCLNSELVNSDEAIKENLGRESNILVYPIGAHNQTVLQMVNKEYYLGVTSHDGINTIRSSCFEIKRCQVKHGESGQALVKHIKSHL